jgi:ABC-type sugar transport system ATPase subunit
MSTPTETSAPIKEAVHVQDVVKWYGGIRALHGVSMSFPPRKVTCLVGDNGAGKSTLVRMLSGVEHPDSGEIRIGDEPVRHFSPQHARDYGIATVFQNLALCDNLDAVANVTLGMEPANGKGPFGILKRGEATRKARALIEEVGGTVRDFQAPVGRMSGGQRQAIAIARALSMAKTLIMLDEPTAALGVRQTAAVLQLVRKVADLGLPVVMISHNLDDVFSVADRIVALRLGNVSLDRDATETTREEVVGCMAGLSMGGPKS